MEKASNLRRKVINVQLSKLPVLCNHTEHAIVGREKLIDKCNKCEKHFCYKCIADGIKNANTLCTDLKPCTVCSNLTVRVDHLGSSFQSKGFLCQQCLLLVECIEIPELGVCGFGDCLNTFRFGHPSTFERRCTNCSRVPCALHHWNTGGTIQGRWYCDNCIRVEIINKI